MCEKNKLNEILSEVHDHSKQLFADSLVDVVLYGSYARGDFDSESDIDIMVLADIEQSSVADFLVKLRDRIYMLEIENDCVISLSVTPVGNFEKYKNVSPFYRNVWKEGVRFAG